MPTPAPLPPAEAVSAFDAWQFGVDLASTIATLALAVAAFVITVRAHRLNEQLRLEARTSAARDKREEFMRALDAYRSELMAAYATPKRNRRQSLQYMTLSTIAIANGRGYADVLAMWRKAELEIMELDSKPGPIAEAVGAAIGAASIITSTWVADPEKPLPTYKSVATYLIDLAAADQRVHD